MNQDLSKSYCCSSCTSGIYWLGWWDTFPLRFCIAQFSYRMGQERLDTFPCCRHDQLLSDRSCKYRNSSMTVLKLLSSGNLSATSFLCKQAPLLFGVWMLLAVGVPCFLSLALSEFGNLAGVVIYCFQHFPSSAAFSLLVIVEQGSMSYMGF